MTRNAVWCLASVLALGGASADTVVLRTGHVLHGTVVDKGDQILVEVKLGGITLDRDEVLTIELSNEGEGAQPAEDTLLLRNGRVLHGNVRFSPDGSEIILAGSRGEARYPRSTVHKILRRDGSTEIPGLTDDSKQGRELQASIRGLVADLGNEDVLKRREALRELLALGPFARDMLEELKDEGGKPLVEFLAKLDRLEAMRQSLPRQAESRIPRLHERLVAEEARERSAAIKAITLEFPEASGPLLLEVVRHDADPEIRSYCVGQLAALRHFEELGQVLQLQEGPLRLAAAFALGDAGIPAGVPILIEALRLKSEEIREVSIERLRDYTGQFFGYRAKATPEEREVAIKRWEKWWAANGEELLRRAIKAVAPDLAGGQISREEDAEARRLWQLAMREITAANEQPQDLDEKSADDELAWQGGRRKKLQQAVDMLSKALEISPGLSSARLTRAVLLYEEFDRSGEAERELKLVAARAKSDLGDPAAARKYAYYHLGQVMLRRGDYERATIELNHALNYDDAFLDAHIAQGDAYFQLAVSPAGDRPLGRDARVESLNSARQAYQNALDAAKQQEEELLEIMRDLVRDTPENVTEGRVVQSVRKSSRELQEQRAALFFKQGQVAAALQDASGARAAFTQARALDPDEPRYVEALKVWGEVPAKAPDAPEPDADQ
ncbi:MAG: hypothetical protein KDD82_02510 [Planctomycetes bacterium]|nr:hypothetical protein [Planctomycetota bacterium]